MMWTRFSCKLQQNSGGKHPYEDRGGRHGGTLVDGEDVPLKELSAANRKIAEADGDVVVRPGTHGTLYYVLDGVGGAPKGGEAAQLVQEGLQRFVRDPGFAPALDDLVRLLGQLNQEVFALGQLADGRSEGAAAMTLAWFSPSGSVTLAHIGDTTAWHFSPATGHLRVLTVEHAEGNKLHRYVGQGAGFAVDLIPVAMMPGDLLCLASDGVTKGLHTGAIGQILARHATAPVMDLHGAAGQIVAAARKGGSTDDITVVLVELDHV